MIGPKRLSNEISRLKRMMKMKTSRRNEVLVEELIVSVRRRGPRCRVDVSNSAPGDRAFMAAIGGVIAAWFNRPAWRNKHDA